MKSTVIVFLSLITLSCSNTDNKKQLVDMNNLQVENDSLKAVLEQNKDISENQLRTFLTFQDNNAEKAMNFYVDIFENSEIIDVKRWQKEAPGQEGKIMVATFNLNGSLFMCSDSPPIHDWNFSPAISNFVECDSESELEDLFTKLSENGSVTMPLNNYGFSQKFGWVVDQFGISWQLNLP